MTAVHQGALMGKLDGKRVLMVIASQQFRDEEYLVPKGLLEAAGAKVTTASSKLGPAKGMLGAVAKPDILLKDAKSADFDAIVFVGGGGAKEYWSDATAHKLATEFNAKGKPTSAICIAPVTLANAGLLKGKAMTAWPDVVERIVGKGGVKKTEGCVRDGNIITADGPESAEAFGKALVEALAR
jgi:protease I